MYLLYFITSCSERAAAGSRGTSYFNTELTQNVLIMGNVNKLDRTINKSCIAASRSPEKALWSPRMSPFAASGREVGGFENPRPKNLPMATPGDPGPFGSGRVHPHLKYK